VVRRLLLAIAAASISAGCNRPTASPGLPAPAKVAFGAGSELAFDFGLTIGEPGQELAHTYQVENKTDHPVRITRVVNAKPCCGEVDGEPTTLQPGQSTEIVVRLRASIWSIGPTVHYATLETDDPRTPAVELRTSATLRPPVGVEESGAGLLTVATGSSEPIRIVIVAYGSADRPPLDLGVVQVRTTLATEWGPPTEPKTLPGGLIEVRRELLVTLDGAAGAGDRAASLAIVDGDAILLDHPIRWRVAPAVVATPPSLIVPSIESAREYRIAIRRPDGAPFTIADLSTDLPYASARRLTEGPGRSHQVLVSFAAASGDLPRRGRVTIATDQVDQPTVEVPILVTRIGSAARPESAP